MAVHHRADFTEREFTVTNKGIRIKASRARHAKAPQYFIFRTNITDSIQPPVKTTIKNPKLVYPVTMEFEVEAWFGIYLTKTARGFVRAQPEKLYVSDKEGEESVGLSGPQNETIYILKDISESESINVRNQDIGSIGLGGYRGTSHCIIEMIQPLEAWDSSRQRILNVNTQRKAKIFEAAPWADINDMETDRNYMDAFIGLKFTSASGDHRPFRVLIACRSGTKSVVWTRSEAVQDEVSTTQTRQSTELHIFPSLTLTSRIFRVRSLRSSKTPSHKKRLSWRLNWQMTWTPGATKVAFTSLSGWQSR